MTDITAHNHDEVSRIVMLAYGTMEHGGPYWCYVAVKPSRYDEFQKAMGSKKYNIQQFDKDGFGEVVVSGEGAVPPGDVTHQVASMFKISLKQLFNDTAPVETIVKKIEYINNNHGNA